MHNDKWHLSWIEWYSILIDNWRTYTSKKDMLRCHYVLQKTTNILAQNTNIRQLTNAIYSHNIITIAIIRSLLVCHKVFKHVPTWSTQTTKSTYLTRIYILFNELLNHRVGSIHIRTHSIQISISLERYVRISRAQNSVAFGYKITTLERN